MSSRELIENKAKKLMLGLQNAAKKHDIDFQINYSGGMFGFFFTDKKNKVDTSA